MFTTHATRATVLLFLFLASALHAQGFNSGSDGSDGDLTVTENSITLDVPPDGIFNFGTVTISNFRSVTFRRNALNTPVYILATGDIRITVGGSIGVDGGAGTTIPPAGGAGGPGGFDGGEPGVQAIAAGFGHGPGGGGTGDNNLPGTDNTSAGAGSYGGSAAQPSASDGSVYGSALLVPLVGGSGGGGGIGSGTGSGRGGSGGGGAILLASNTEIVITHGGGLHGIFARGGDNPFPDTGQGSGGGIRLVAPKISGDATLSVRGGTGSVNASNGDVGGHGRIRIDTIDRTGIRFNYDPPAASSIGTFMAVFPPVVPRLEIVQAAGQAIAPGQPAEVILPFGSPPAQTVTVRATDFTGSVPIDVVLVPSTGPRQVVPAQINMTTNPAQVIVGVNIPANTRTRVYAWTR